MAAAYTSDGQPLCSGRRRSLPGRSTRFAHVIEEEEEEVDMKSEQPDATSPEADSGDEEEESVIDEYGLHAIDRQHLNTDQWEDAVISSASYASLTWQPI